MTVPSPRTCRWALLAVLASAVTACGGGSSAPSTSHSASHRGGTMTMLWSGVGTSIDPQLDYDENWQLLVMTNDGLMAWKRVNGAASTQLVPDLASSIPTPTDGGKTWVFHIRSGIHFSNGQLLKPSDVTYSLEREFKVAGPGEAFFDTIVGATACGAKPKTCNLSAGVAANDAAGTVTFHLTAPDPQLLQSLALPLADIVPAGTPDHDTGTQPVPATGPYMISSYQPTRQIVFVRNPHFHQWSALAQPQGYPNQIVLKIGIPLEQETNEVENGQADWMYNSPPPDRLASIASKYSAQLHIYPSVTVYYMSLDNRTAPFDNLKAREAVNYATDRAAVIKLWGGPGTAQPTCQILPPNFPAYQPYCPYTANPGTTWTAPDMAKARQLVAQSGTRGDSIGVITATDSTSENIGTYFVSLLDQLGYKAHLRALASAVEYSIQQNSSQDPQMSFTYWDPDYPDPADFFNLEVGCNGFHANSNSSPNLSEFCQAGIQRQVEHALTVEETNRTDADALWTQLDREVTDQAAQLSLFVPKTLVFVSKNVGHVEYSDSSDGGLIIDQAWVN